MIRIARVYPSRFSNSNARATGYGIQGCVIEDLNSTNGVFVDEKQVRKYRLNDGDIVSLGVHQLVYRDLRESDDDSGKSSEEEDARSDTGT